jgi:hypothetical protein
MQHRPHQTFVPGPDRRAPVLAGQIEVVGGKSGLGLQVIAVADQGLRAGADSGKHRPDVHHVTALHLRLRIADVRADQGVEALMCCWVVGQYPNPMTGPVRGREEAQRHRVGGIAGQQNQGHSVLLPHYCRAYVVLLPDGHNVQSHEHSRRCTCAPRKQLDGRVRAPSR